MNRVKNKSHPSRVIPLSTPGNASMVGIVILWHPLWAIEESVGTTSRDACRLRLDYRVIHDHARNAFAIRFLLGRVDTVRVRVHRQAVYFLLNRKVFQLAVVIGIIHLEHRDSSARTRHVNPLETGIEFDYVRTARHRQKGDGLVSVQIEDRHKVVPFAPSHRIAPYRFIRGRIDDGEIFLSWRLTYTFWAMGSYCGIPASLSKCSVFTRLSVRTSTMASALPRSSETYSL